LPFDSCSAGGSVAAGCSSFAIPVIADRRTAVINAGRRRGGNNCGRPIIDINRASKRGKIIAIVNAITEDGGLAA